MDQYEPFCKMRLVLAFDGGFFHWAMLILWGATWTCICCKQIPSEVAEQSIDQDFDEEVATVELTGLTETSDSLPQVELASSTIERTTVRPRRSHQPVVLTELGWEVIVAVIFGSMLGSCLLTLIVYCACGRPEEGHLI
ncbi:hypothetical protein BV898_02729 [Hypsibius exemplaris]|uniref:Uncharacterized protein n=1 Tax=Hypsibius exemplaris TaxID=2072580 RepID=A0A1W0X7A0_HYPEX|nr:hypothetical protein BV898_02729 [Hypsibius exemplaris]